MIFIALSDKSVDLIKIISMIEEMESLLQQEQTDDDRAEDEGKSLESYFKSHMNATANST